MNHKGKKIEDLQNGYISEEAAIQNLWEKVQEIIDSLNAEKEEHKHYFHVAEPQKEDVECEECPRGSHFIEPSEKEETPTVKEPICKDIVHTGTCCKYCCSTPPSNSEKEPEMLGWANRNIAFGEIVRESDLSSNLTPSEKEECYSECSKEEKEASEYDEDWWHKFKFFKEKVERMGVEAEKTRDNIALGNVVEDTKKECWCKKMHSHDHGVKNYCDSCTCLEFCENCHMAYRGEHEKFCIANGYKVEPPKEPVKKPSERIMEIEREEDMKYFLPTKADSDKVIDAIVQYLDQEYENKK